MGKRLIIKGASFSINAIDRITPSTTYYSVIYNLSHCTASNSATSIAAGSTYEVTITAQSGYTLSSVTVRHNGQTVSPISGNTYRIINVSGNITVTATATADVTTYTVTYDLENATASNNATSVVAGSSYTVTLTPNSGYTISSATVTHNRVEIEPTSGYTYDIPSVSGNILVECVAVESQTDITNLFANWVSGAYSANNGNKLTSGVFVCSDADISQYAGKEITFTHMNYTTSSLKESLYGIAFYSSHNPSTSTFISGIKFPIGESTAGYAEGYYTTGTIPSNALHIGVTWVQDTSKVDGMNYNMKVNN